MNMRKRAVSLAIALPLLCLLGAFAYNLPPIHERLAWRLDALRTRLLYALHPPEEALFVPQAQTQLTLTPTSQPTRTATLSPTLPGPTETPLPSPTSTITPTPLPERVALEGVKYEDQHNRWNYCGPANLSMALTFWGWGGNRDVVGRAIKPNDDDKNIMPYEMEDFVETQTEGLEALVRFGGDIDLLKRLVAAGFPVVTEKGYYERDFTGKVGWLGHYQFVTGYDDTKGVLIVQDTYIKAGENHEFPYPVFLEGWRSFNYTFLVVYPVERREQVLALLGPYADPTWATRHALQVAQAETQTQTGIHLFFAWFNVGTSHVNLQEYGDATYAYDYAFSTVYANLKEEDLRPYRVMWYQTWPYWAYFYTGRYQDVINLANTTLLETISEPVLEESFYWRALAREALGDRQGAIDDLRESVRLNRNFGPGWEQLNRLGVGSG
ncbi:MAG TPA: C39 family peptidase [Anaerolineales bacterium]|nr:C39 family peptidase [Anaerolineales bacterium]